MNFRKRILSIFLTAILLCTLLSTNTFAEANTPVPEMENTDGENTSLKKLDTEAMENAPSLPDQEFNSLEGISDEEKKSLKIPTDFNPLKSRDNWRISESVFVGDGTLDEVFDTWIVTLDQKMLSFLKLSSSNSNLMAVIYNLDANGNLAGSSGFGVMANDDCNFVNIPAGTYAILVGSATGTETGDYTLMWNCSNPSNYIYTDKNNNQEDLTPKSLLSVSDDLTNVVVYYGKNVLLINGTDALSNLIWADSQTWTNNYGYTARDMKLTLYEWSRLYLANITTTAPCSVPRALMIEVRKGMWRYCNSYYYNNAGDVKHEMNFNDLSGIRTPRVFGDEATDFEYGPSYLVVDLDTLKVVDYISPFNYYYQVGGRTYTSSNVQQLT